MPKINWLDKLNDEQAIYAAQVAEKAQQMGVPVELALSLAYHESGFDPKKIGGAQEIGLMQVLPSTGKMLGYSPKQLADPSQNIEAGLKYLKSHLDTYHGVPEVAALAYNRGPGVADRFIAGESDKAGEEYVKRLNGLGAFSGRVQVSPEQAMPPPAEPEVENVNEKIAQLTGLAEQGRQKQEQETTGLLGAGIGAGAQGLALGKQAIGKTAESIAKSAEMGKMAARAATGAASSQAGYGGRPPIYTDPQVERLLEGTTNEMGLTGRARQESYNTRSAQQASARRAAAPGYEELVRRGIVPSTDEFFARQPTQVATKEGLLISADAARRMEEEAAASLAAQRQAAALAAKPASSLEQITQTFRSMMASPAARLASRALTPLGLYGAGYEGMGAVQEMQKSKPNYPLAIGSGLSAIGSAMSAYPPAALIGLPVMGTGALIKAAATRPSEPLESLGLPIP